MPASRPLGCIAALIATASVSFGCRDGPGTYDAEDDDAATQIDQGSGMTSGALETDGLSPEEAMCFEAWAMPSALVTAAALPDGPPGMRLHFGYEPGLVTLTEVTGEEITMPSDGPFVPGTDAGSWAELRDGADATIYTRFALSLVPETVETTGPLGQHLECPKTGFFSLPYLPNDPAATSVVLFQEPIDGLITNETIELVRFELPAAN